LSQTVSLHSGRRSVVIQGLANAILGAASSSRRKLSSLQSLNRRPLRTTSSSPYLNDACIIPSTFSAITSRSSTLAVLCLGTCSKDTHPDPIEFFSEPHLVERHVEHPTAEVTGGQFYHGLGSVQGRYLVPPFEEGTAVASRPATGIEYLSTWAYRSKNTQALSLAFRGRVGADNIAVELVRAQRRGRRVSFYWPPAPNRSQHKSWVVFVRLL
jgi:hypothetical protein